MLGALLLVAACGWGPAAAAEVASRLADSLPKVQPGEMIPGADRFGPMEGKPAPVTVYRGKTLLGYAFLNADVVNATGYSGKPISIMLGLDTAGVMRAAAARTGGSAYVARSEGGRRLRETVRLLERLYESYATIAGRAADEAVMTGALALAETVLARRRLIDAQPPVQPASGS